MLKKIPFWVGRRAIAVAAELVIEERGDNALRAAKRMQRKARSRGSKDVATYWSRVARRIGTG